MSLTADQMRERLQKALDFGGGDHSVDELVTETMMGRMQCFHSDDAVVFTQIEKRGKGKVMNVYLAAGVLEAVLALQDEFMEFARQEGCVSVLCHGRMGWAKALPENGWKPKYMTWEREL
jgi:hypothetical protein